MSQIELFSIPGSERRYRLTLAEGAVDWTFSDADYHETPDQFSLSMDGQEIGRLEGDVIPQAIQEPLEEIAVGGDPLWPGSRLQAGGGEDTDPRLVTDIALTLVISAESGHWVVLDDQDVSLLEISRTPSPKSGAHIPLPAGPDPVEIEITVDNETIDQIYERAE